MAVISLLKSAGLRTDAGVLAVLAAALLWATIGIWSVSLFEAGITPLDVAFWRATIAAVTLAGWAAVRRPDLFRLDGARDLALLTGYAGVAVVLFYPALLLAIEGTSVAVASVLLYTAPIFVALGARAWLGERIGPRRGTSLVVVVCGVWATALGAVGAEVEVTLVGVVWGVIAGMAYASYYLFGRRFVPRIGAARTLLWSILLGTPLLGLVLVAAGRPPTLDVPVQAWPALAALAIPSTVLANGVYYWGIRRTEANRAAVVACVEPVMAALLALWIFDQRLVWLGWIGVALVAGGVAYGSIRQREPRR